MPRILCDSCKGRGSYTSGGYNEYQNKCSSCHGTGIDVKATLISLETEINKLREENKLFHEQVAAMAKTIERLVATRDRYRAILEHCGIDPITGESATVTTTKTQPEQDEYDAMIKQHKDSNKWEEPIEIPVNLEACFTSIKEIMREEEIKRFKEDSEKDAIGKYHFGFGQWIRNNWGLWTGSKLKDWFVAKGLHHADDMSGVILVSFWRHLNNKPIDLGEQIKHYQDYWKNLEERK